MTVITLAYLKHYDEWLISHANLNKILDIYAHARKFMALTGNPNQWINNYPSIDILSNDLDKKQLYVYFYK